METIEQLKKEVKTLYMKIDKLDSYLLRNNIKARDTLCDYFGGIQIFHSKLITKPLFMIIGINPGNYDARELYEPVERYDPLENHEYIEPKYKLGKQTNKMFDKIGDINLLEESVKTNYCYLSTKDEDTLDKLRTFLKIHLDIDVFSFADKWTAQLVEIIKPQIILCEGIRAYDHVYKIYKNKVVNELKYKPSISKVKMCRLENGIYILGYKRNHSSILNMDIVVEYINKALRTLQVERKNHE